MRFGRTNLATILVAEDDPALSCLFRVVLNYYGHQAVEVTTQREALQRIMREVPNLLIVDLNLGEDDGADLARAARTERPDLPVLFTSGTAESTLRRDQRLSSDDCFLAKPFSITALREALGRLLGDQPCRRNAEPASWHVPSVSDDNGAVRD